MGPGIFLRLFDPERKRPLPEVPAQIGLITAANSAAYSDFIKIVNERWGGLEILFADVYVQGEQAPAQLVDSIKYFNQMVKMPEVLAIVRGGGSADDLAAFNDERVVRAVAASRIPTLVAIGHEIDVSLAELAADQRASTPTNAAQLVVPDRVHILDQLDSKKRLLQQAVITNFEDVIVWSEELRRLINDHMHSLVESELNNLRENRRLISHFNPRAVLKRGYAIIYKSQQHISSTRQLKLYDQIGIEMSDGTISAIVSSE